MKKVLDTVSERTHRIEDHPLHGWLSAPDEHIEDKRKLWFCMYFVNFIMYFRELNLYHISYGADRSRDPLREALSRHADEDMTHSRLFMKDFRALGMDKTLGWKSSQVLYWMASSPINDPLRRRTSELTKVVVSTEDPKILYPVVESFEACGHALFKHTAVLAERITHKTGLPLIYWGQHHLERETGHAVETGEDLLFRDLQLTTEQRNEATHKVIRVFELIEEQNSDMLRLAQETISQGSFAIRTRLHTRPQTPVPVLRSKHETPNSKRYDFNFLPDRPHPSQKPIVDALCQQVLAIDAYKHSEIFKDRGLDDIIAKLRLYTLFFSSDITGSRTAYRYLMPVPSPKNATERAANRLTQRFGHRAQMMYVDWQSLMLDRALSWPTSRMLEFVYLDAHTEACRDLRNTIVRHVDRQASALHTYWTMVAIKTFTNSFSEPISRLARRAEHALGLDLPYLMQRPNPEAPALEPDPEADAVQLESIPVSEMTRDELIAAVNDVGNALSAVVDAMEDALKQHTYPEIYQPLTYREAA
ncbi:MAG: hypothetical protein AAF978_04245 [Cyanobacteria bacterium P01_E01_bin.48]